MNWRLTSSQLQRASEPSGDRISETTPKAVLHLFSNSGSIKLRHLLHCLDARNVKLKTRAVILDSCPCRASLEGGSHFVTVGIKNSVARVIARNGSACCVSNVYDGQCRICGGWNLDENITQPRLFLYNEEDKLCQVHEIQERIAACKAEGIVVEENGSDHMRHTVVHKEEYWSLVTAFPERGCW
ncbi:hypothetical protein CcCBS67573_g08840 [Chytriomyces confervae]|uniref:Uncharacterized protein n=1 Tax=Chytriomyces confervae TaxID=246404 RepID=A0A507EGV2_9FUNG|nr:hypothetical protein CcCBS67573_g08840 [Chytriomyces confervae]